MKNYSIVILYFYNFLTKHLCLYNLYGKKTSDFLSILKIKAINMFLNKYLNM